MREADLPDRRRRLAFLQAQRAAGQVQVTPPQRDRAGGDEDHLLAAAAQPAQVFHQRLEPRAVEPPGFLIDQQRRADLHDHAPGGDEGRIRRGARLVPALHGPRTICEPSTPHEGPRNDLRPHGVALRICQVLISLLLGRIHAAHISWESSAVGRDYEPVVGQWYENIEEDDSFRVLSVDPDAELVEIEYLDGDIEEIDLDTWHEMDLERIAEPEGWAAEDDEEEEDEEEEDEDDDDWDEDEDDEDDEDWDEEEEDKGSY
jgi:hypothetical protein